MINLQEAFTKLSMLEGEDYNLLDASEKEALSDFLNSDDEEPSEVDVIDPNADNEFDLEDSYLGKILVECPVCKSPIFRTVEEMEENKGKEETCPYCQSAVVMDIIGKIVSLDEEPAAEEPAEEEGEEDEAPIEESRRSVRESKRNRRNRRRIREDLENVTVETENEIINISSEDKNDAGEEFDDTESAEVIAPMDGDEYVDSEESEGGEDEVDEFDEESFDKVAESFFRENYKNVKSFRTRKAYDKGNHIVVEGVVTLKDGSRKLTEFRVRTGRFDRRTNRAACLIENLQLGKKKVVAVSVRPTRMNEGIFGNKKNKSKSSSSNGKKYSFDEIKSAVQDEFGDEYRMFNGVMDKPDSKTPHTVTVYGKAVTKHDLRDKDCAEKVANFIRKKFSGVEPSIISNRDY